MNKKFIENLKVGDKVVRVCTQSLHPTKRNIAIVKRITKTQIVIEFKCWEKGNWHIEKYRKNYGTIIKRKLKGLSRCVDSYEHLEEYKSEI